MALLNFAVLIALVWGLGALQLWPRLRWIGEVQLWLGVALAVGVAACVAWGFVGVFRYSDWQGLSTGQAMRALFGAGTSWFQRTGWAPIDGVANAYLSLDLLWTLLVLSAAAMHGYVFWTGAAEGRRRTRARMR